MAVRTQQDLVYQRLQKNRESIIEANKGLGERAAIIVGGGTALATFFGAGEMWTDNAETWLLVAAAVASLLVFVAASFVWVPKGSLLPGSIDEGDLWDGIIDQSEDVAIANMIRDEIAAIESEIEGNQVRSRAFLVMLVGVWCQVTFVFFAVWLGK